MRLYKFINKLKLIIDHGTGHISKNGGKFIAKKMIEKNWFNLN